MKTFFKLVILLTLCLGCIIYAKAESNPNKFTNIVVVQKNGRQNDDGTTTYGETRRRLDAKTKTLHVYCYGPGDYKCPAEVTVFVTIITGVSYNESVIHAIDVIKSNITEGESEGRLVRDDILYQWSDGILHDNGTFEMNLLGRPFNEIIP